MFICLHKQVRVTHLQFGEEGQVTESVWLDFADVVHAEISTDTHRKEEEECQETFHGKHSKCILIDYKYLKVNQSINGRLLEELMNVWLRGLWFEMNVIQKHTLAMKHRSIS